MPSTDSNMQPIEEAGQFDPHLSKVSQQYDRGNKGYLDPTEKKLREMDSQNLGHLDINKVYALMQSMETEQKKALTLKRVVIALVAFAVLLCLANIGTSFAAAKLAKDMQTANGQLLVVATGERVNVGTLNSVTELDQAPVGSNRYLQVSLGGQGGQGTRSPLIISQNKADRIFKSFCDKWVGISNYKCSDPIPCQASSGSEEIVGCEGLNYRASLTYYSKPQCEENGNKLRFKFNACRDRYCYGLVEFVCDRNVKVPCDVINFPCDTVCSICNKGGGESFWFCDQGFGCGCVPNQCPSGKNYTCYECYDPSSTTRMLEEAFEELEHVRKNL